MHNNSSIKLSILLPIYNVEPYLEKCLRSLENQDIPKESYEIICVNDGSPDNSKLIVEQLQKEFSNISLINQTNKGVSVARNNAMKEAKGEYLLFIDPDDYVRPDCLNELLKYTESKELDVVFSPFTFVEPDGSKKETFYKEGLDIVIPGIDFYFKVRGDSVLDPDRSVAILYKRELLLKNELYYLGDVPYLEDGEFIARVLCLAKKCSVYNIPYYMRLNRPGSATRSNLFFQEKSMKGFLRASKNLLEFKKKKQLNREQKLFLNQPICKFVLLSMQSCGSNYRKLFFVKNTLTKSSLSKLELEGCRSPYYELGAKFNFSMNYFFIYSNLDYLKKGLVSKLKRS